MPEESILEPAPTDVAADLNALSASLDPLIPAKTLDRNLLIATWNLRAFGGLTKKWRSQDGDTPRRDFHDLICIAEIISRFDVVALQEVRGDLRALRHLMKALGWSWGFILTDVTRGKSGNDERLAFVFDSRRVRPSGLAAELVVSLEEEASASEETIKEQFARTPYAVSFLSAGTTFILLTLHVKYGKKAADRLPELREIAKWAADWGRREKDFKHNLIVLGDFNIDRKGDPLYEAFVETGLRPARELEGLPRTIFQEPGEENYYDQIAWFGEGRQGLVPPLQYENKGGNFDFTKILQGDLSKQELSWRISDHYPLWTSFSIRKPRVI